MCRTLDSTVTLVVPAPFGRLSVLDEDLLAVVKVNGSCEMTPQPSLLADPSIPRHRRRPAELSAVYTEDPLKL